ncbi:MAG: hypothetical protein HY648_08820 [Acidobacteria bacterium]|nr:hypothetical protein [Acidobacteriota bacterium]
MADLLLNKGEKIHVIARRRFEGDIRRHFVGEVRAATGNAARVEGYAFVFDKSSGIFVKRPERRSRIIGLLDAALIINILPPTVEVESLSYQMSGENHLVITDGKIFSLDINEFGVTR